MEKDLLCKGVEANEIFGLPPVCPIQGMHITDITGGPKSIGLSLITLRCEKHGDWLKRAPNWIKRLLDEDIKQHLLLIVGL
ncbi:hypothetical protein [Dethiosulfatarculus sandiegensis]|uniref:Uncharacterized protein n=1 Tax=Dethiosulfatarculus sandiegensis TaxID=1429043 RepID=A0A0D2J6U2_9BACT|nr:hypothetical protein [Dethiosulfatarculus sandiegensis]KIX13894.1 hypothetical protein X474_11860 [Dethiosulfatarculus sandiegensis]